MKVSAFTFIRNGEILGYPFIQSIKSILPIVDEFVINVGYSEDRTLEIIKSIKNKKIRIIKSHWSEKMTNKGYVYGQQKMIAQFNCTGDWLFYIEGDELYHEDNLQDILSEMKNQLDNPSVEALAFKFIHFYGNKNTYLDSPGWYRSEARIIKSNIRSYAPDGLFWLVLEKNKVGRYPRAKLLDICCYHYGWVRTEHEMNLKSKKVQKYWGGVPHKIDYKNMDGSILKNFQGSHPKVIKSWLPKVEGLQEVNKDYRLSSKQKKHRIMRAVEKFFGIDLSKKHYKKI